MKIAVISDIHGNQYAMKAVDEDIRKNNIDKVLVLGDVVGHYYAADEVMNILSDYERKLIKGNHEAMLFRAKDDQDFLEQITDRYGHGIKEAIRRLSLSQLEELENLEESKELKIDGLSLMICHGSPWDMNERIYPDCDQEQREKFSDFDYDYIFLGHSHYPFMFETGKTRVINVGSVGQSRTKGGLAQWVILDTKSRTISPMATVYDVNDLLREVKAIDPDQSYLQDVLFRK